MPSSVTVGAAAQVLTINGTGFLASSTVTYNAQAHTATFVSSTQLTISLSTSDQAAAGNYPLVVTNPAPGGGTSNALNFTVSNPVPTVSSASPLVIAAGAPDTTIALTGTNFLPASKVNFNGAPLPTNFVSSTQLTAIIPSASLHQSANDQITILNPSPGGGISATQTLSVVVIGSLTMTAAPQSGGPGNGPWQLSIAAADSAGNSVQGLTVSLGASEGTLSLTGGITDSSGTITATISPPASYSDEAVAVRAITGAQTVVVNVAFVPYTFNPSSARSHSETQVVNNSTSGTGAFTVPFVFGTSSVAGSSNPFLTPSSCYTNVVLNSTIPVDCQFLYTGQGFVQSVLDATNLVCKATAKATTIAGGLSCAGIVATVISCVASPTGIGAVICSGGLTYSGVLGPLCLGFLTDVLAGVIAPQVDKTAIDEISIGIQPGPPSIGDYVGLVCDAVDSTAIGCGTGSSGTKVCLSPARATIRPGSPVQFSATVTGNSNPSVVWSVNGIAQGAGPYGTVTTNGLFTAPSLLPIPNRVTIAAVSVGDQSASAPAIVTVMANPAGTITTVAGKGTAGYAGDNGPATGAQLAMPSGIAFDGGGNMFIADSGNNAARRVDASTGLITTIAGTGVAGYAGDGGTGTNAELNGPTHVVFDRTVNLYITDANNERIRKVNAVTDQITTVAGNGTAGFSGDGGLATSAQLNFPDGVALDSSGNLFIGDALNNRIRKVAITTGNIVTVAGKGSAGYSGDGGSATNASLSFPSRPFVDVAGNIYIADYQNNRVRKVDGVSGVITTIVGTGVAGYSGDAGPAIAARLNGPLSIALNASGTVLYVADTNNERIRAVNQSTSPTTVLAVTIQPGQIQTVVGRGTSGYSGDGGPAIAAAISFPTGLTVDAAGNLFFADAANNVIREVNGPFAVTFTPATPANDYPYASSTADTPDPWGFYTRECTSYIAWRMNRDSGRTASPWLFTNLMSGGHWGNAENWNTNALLLGYAVNSTPAVGAIAQWTGSEIGSTGHVAYVENIIGSNISISEYNYPSGFTWDYRTISASSVPRFIHVGH
ncbi:MAG: CHAP domain-containing protein [Acidobacteriia bacterium]|nr:CHAP domain-containing protein [Terriglobia bacterium]